MDYEALATEITTGPRAADCAPYVHTNSMPKITGAEARVKDQAVADILNEPTGTRHVERNVNARTLLSVLGAVQGAAVLDALEAAAAVSSPVKWALKFLVSPEGINLGDPQTLGMLDALQGQNVLTAEQVTALKAMVAEPGSRALTVVGQPVTAADVSIAVRGGQGWGGIE